MTDIYSSISISLHVAGASTLLAFVAGVCLAWFLAFSRQKCKEAVAITVNLPLALPPTVIGYILLLILGRHGPVGLFLQSAGLGSIIFTPASAVLAAFVVSLPLMVQAARGSFESIPPEVMEAAQMDGADTRLMVWHILIPLAKSGLTLGVIISFARAIGEFGATSMVAGNIPGKTQTIPLAIYTAVQSGRILEAGLLVAMLTAIAGASMWGGLRWRATGFR